MVAVAWMQVVPLIVHGGGEIVTVIVSAAA